MSGEKKSGHGVGLWVRRVLTVGACGVFGAVAGAVIAEYGDPYDGGPLSTGSAQPSERPTNPTPFEIEMGGAAVGLATGALLAWRMFPGEGDES